MRKSFASVHAGRILREPRMNMFLKLGLLFFTTTLVAAERFDAARADADAADARVAGAADPASLPPLLGVPCTIKESIGVEGMPNCAGVVARTSFISLSPFVSAAVKIF